MTVHFDSERFLQENHRLPLVLIRQQLNSHLSQYKNELIELINADYADFINLSSNLNAVAPLIKDLDLSVIATLQVPCVIIYSVHICGWMVVRGPGTAEAVGTH